jgi:hypothetical protein
MPTHLLSTVAPYFRPYVDLLNLSGENYYFRKTSTSLRDHEGKPRYWHPKIAHVMLRSYHSSTDGILYAALPRSANVYRLGDDDLLYLGCSASGGSRYWRGRPSENGKYLESKSCFHHEQMRRGRDLNNLENYLAQIGPVRVYTLTNSDVVSLCAKHQIALPSGKYPAHQLERMILAEGFRNWKWNRRS